MPGENIPKLVKKVLPAVVTITVSKFLPVFESPFGVPPLGEQPQEFEEYFMVPKGKKKAQVGGGSGFIVDSSGLILTNRHVVADPNAEYIALLSNDKKYKIEILAKDPINDIAVLKIPARGLPVVELGNSSAIELGQTVTAIGNSLGIFRNTVSVGVVSGLSRQISAFSAFDQKAQKLRGLIQTDAAINPGNSGGPLIDLEGKAIGVNAAMVLMAENIGFALPINAAKRDLQDLKGYGRIRLPFLGVRYVQLNQPLKKKYNLPLSQGALVISEGMPEGEAVVKGSSADKAGLKEGDIVLNLNKEEITEENSLEDILHKFSVGDTIELRVFRNDREITCKAVIQEKK
ncbi:MAG: trypsin-like peptidase domain-containing protein [Candidatus Nealsonbacteria bacterium]|nr:trypsin-like peptidase domain-containing protein [Candidatus Nealsonbacteria bacterium]